MEMIVIIYTLNHLSDLSEFKSVFIDKTAMISTKLKKDAKTQDLLVEFSSQEVEGAVERFLKNCREEGVLIRRSPQPLNELNFYHVQEQTSLTVKEVTLANLPTELKPALRVIYLNNDED